MISWFLKAASIDSTISETLQMTLMGIITKLAIATETAIPLNEVRNEEKAFSLLRKCLIFMNCVGDWNVDYETDQELFKSTRAYSCIIFI